MVEDTAQQTCLGRAVVGSFPARVARMDTRKVSGREVIVAASARTQGEAAVGWVGEGTEQ